MTVSILNSKDLFDFGSYNTYVKKTNKVKFNVDPVACACFLDRIAPTTGYESIVDPTVQASVTQEDLDRALEIRDHYSKRIMMWKLMGEELTKYRESLNNFIHQEDLLVVDEDYFGLIIKLPKFYKYDLEFDNMKYGAVDATYVGHPFKTTIELTPIALLTQKTRLDSTNEYWLKDDQNRRFCIPVQASNPLDHLYRKLFDKKEPLLYTAQVGVKRRNSLKYYIFTRWEIV